MSLLGEARLNIGAREVLFSLAGTVLLATDVFVGRKSDMPQTAEAYFSAEPRAHVSQTAAVSIDISFVLTCLLWILFPKFAKTARVVLLALAVAGIVVGWSTIVWAAGLQSPVYVLRELPFRPLANYGMVGTVVFGAYLAYCLPTGRMSRWSAFVIRTLLAACQALFQWVVWDTLSHSLGRGS